MLDNFNLSQMSLFNDLRTTVKILLRRRDTILGLFSLSFCYSLRAVIHQLSVHFNRTTWEP